MGNRPFDVCRFMLRASLGSRLLLALTLLAGPFVAAQTPTVEQPPDLAKISFSSADAGQYVTVTGLPGAVPGAYDVFLQCLQTGHSIRTVSAANGSFSGRIAAPDGSTVAVNYGPTGAQSWLEGSPAVLVPVNLRKPPGSSVSFTTASADLSLSGFWVADGVVAGNRFQPGETLEYRIRITYYSALITPALDLSRVQLNAQITLVRISDATGKPIDSSFVPVLLTPAGLPIMSRDGYERGSVGPAAPGRTDGFIASVSALQRVGNTLATDAVFTLRVPGPQTLPSGHYAGKLSVNLTGAAPPAGPPQGDLAFANGGFAQPLTPVVRIGPADPPKIPWMLLANTLSNSTRGAVAREDRDSFHLATKVAFNAEKFIVRKGTYRLEPFLPTISHIEGGPNRPVPPIVTFQFPSGELEVSVTRPDGTVERLGKSPFLSGREKLPGGREGEFGPTSVTALYELTTGSPAFDYRFADYGQYLVTMKGWAEDAQGFRYSGGGTYEVYVAEPLDLDLGTFQGTPFQVGDTVSPVVHIRPGVPADVRIDWKLFPNSDASKAIIKRIGGRANRYGYFHPGAGVEPIVASAPGEYVMDVSASYVDQSGVLWMGALKGASVVETPNSSLIAHGKRGITNVAGVPETMPTWFQMKNINPPGVSGEEDTGVSPQMFFPYHTGDVLWSADQTGSGIFPILTLQDPLSITKLAQVADVKSRSLGEIPIDFVRGPFNLSATQLPEFLKTWAYHYTSVQRPGVTVRSIVGAGDVPRAYWQFADPYNGALGNGNQGDLPGDVKLQYGGMVYRDLEAGDYQYAIYGSMVAMIPRGTALSQRCFPPFQGAAGGPSGGPLLTLQGKDIDIFFTPVGAMPGSVLETGDVFAFSGAMWPTLPSRVTVTVTKPGGGVVTITGRANKIGYFYQPASDFIADEPGIYSVKVIVAHEAGDLTSAGPMQRTVQGSVLGASESTYFVYAIPRESTEVLGIDTPRTGAKLNDPSRINGVEVGASFPIRAQVPAGLTNVSAHYSVNNSGTVLESGSLSLAGDGPAYTYNLDRLSKLFTNLDLNPADTVVITLWISGRNSSNQAAYYARQVLLQGKDVFALMEPSLKNLYFAQLGNGQGASSTLILVNGSRRNRTTGTAGMFDSGGKALALNVNGTVQNGSFPFTLPPLGAEFHATNGQGGLAIGSLRLALTSPAGATVLFTGDFGAAGVGAAELATRFLVPIESDFARNTRTGVAISNPLPFPVTITLRLRTAEGLPVSNGNIAVNLPANGQLAKFPEEMFDPRLIDFSQFRGVLEVTSPQAITGMAIRVSPDQLATLPVTGTGSKRLLFSQFGEAQGISSTLTFVNPAADKTAAVTVRLYDDEGSPLTVSLNGVERPGQFSFSIPPQGSATFASAGTSTTPRVGSVVVDSTENIGGTILFGGSFGLAGVDAGQQLLNLIAPVQQSTAGGVAIGLALMNVGSSQVSVRLTLRDPSGNPVTGGTADVLLKPNGHAAQFLSQLFPSLNLSDFRGTITGDATSTVAATVIRQSSAPQEFATLPVTEVIP